MLYFAYGSNLNVTQMEWRCPAARPLFHAELPDWRLTFRTYLDIEPKKGFVVPGVVWRVTENCLLALDRYEGVSSGFYKRIEFDLEGEKEPLIAYRMTGRRRRQPPSRVYLETCRDGYHDFGIKLDALEDALARAEKTEKDVWSWTANNDFGF